MKTEYVYVIDHDGEIFSTLEDEPEHAHISEPFAWRIGSEVPTIIVYRTEYEILRTREEERDGKSIVTFFLKELDKS